ncbi:hypothetical protein F4859DRAFT_146912 [Xylaria cf. heliscus]|nr:hypothetical protein F4859DRAFT_146912 [Xylaria cf. heliscus]
MILATPCLVLFIGVAFSKCWRSGGAHVDGRRYSFNMQGSWGSSLVRDFNRIYHFHNKQELSVFTMLPPRRAYTQSCRHWEGAIVLCSDQYMTIDRALMRTVCQFHGCWVQLTSRLIRK